MATFTFNNFGDLEISDAYIFSKNFKGAKRIKNNKVVNAEGTRTFCVRIDDVDLAQELKENGWNVSINASDNGDEPFCFVPVEARYNKYPPSIFMVSSGHAHELNVNHVHEIDEKRFNKINLVIHPRRYQNDAGEWKIKAFLTEGWFYLAQSRFAEEWAAQNQNYDDYE